MYNIRAERIRLGLSAATVAQAVGVHKNAIYRWECGITEPSGSHLVKLATLYGCSPDYLLGFTEDRNGKAVATV